MRLLLDENLPRKLRTAFGEHEVLTASDMNWKGKSNGALLAAMLEEGFEGLLTADKNLRYQQNFTTYPIPVIVLNALFITYDDLLPLVPKVLDLLEGTLPNGPIIVQP